MRKSKRNRPPDRLSELPDSVIFHIFWFMPMTSVVRTTLLSKRWKNLWTINPCLNFDCSELDYDKVRVRNFVNRALLSWRGIKILKFRCYPMRSLCNDFDLWVCFAVDKNVEELYVHGDKLEQDMGYLVPQCLYSCSSLKVLLLEECELIIHGHVKWNHLKSLTIVSGSDYLEALYPILSGSPQLEVLILALDHYVEYLTIRSNSLKRLSFENYFGFYDPTDSCIELKIWTPNLEMLEISGVPYGKFKLMNVSSLTDATLAFYSANDSFRMKDTDLWGILRPILLNIQDVEKLRLSNWCIKVIGDVKRKHLLSPFPNVNFLELHASCVEYELIFSLLEIFPQLEMLVLQDENKIWDQDEPESPKFDANSSLKFEANLPKSFLQQLRTVEITWAESDNSMFPFIEILLKHASNLEKMVIRVIRVEGVMPSTYSWISASQKLLGIQRSLPNCRVSLL